MKVFVLLALALPALLSCSKPAQPVQAMAPAAERHRDQVLRRPPGRLHRRGDRHHRREPEGRGAPLGRVAGAGRLGRVQLGGRQVLVDGAVVRVPDPFANAANAESRRSRATCSTSTTCSRRDLRLVAVHPRRKDGFARPARQFERDFEGLMGNPIRAAAYAKAAKRGHPRQRQHQRPQGHGRQEGLRDRALRQHEQGRTPRQLHAPERRLASATATTTRRPSTSSWRTRPPTTPPPR